MGCHCLLCCADYFVVLFQSLEMIAVIFHLLLYKSAPRNSHGFDHRVKKSPEKRKWQPTLVFLPGEPHGLQPTRLLHPWDFSGKNIGVGCHFLLQGIFSTQQSNPGGFLHCRQILYQLATRDKQQDGAKSDNSTAYFSKVNPNSWLTYQSEEKL